VKTDIGAIRGLYPAAAKHTTFRVTRVPFVTAQYFCLKLILCGTSSVDENYFELFHLARK
jgi:hypothetical protein